ncbi:MAG: hypothetical protein ABIJ45_08010 [Candidatus Zixiibacteriota bacterium]
MMKSPEITRFISDRFEDKDELLDVLEWLIKNYDNDINNIIRLSFAIKQGDKYYDLNVMSILKTELK